MTNSIVKIPNSECELINNQIIICWIYICVYSSVRDTTLFPVFLYEIHIYDGRKQFRHELNF